MGQVRMCGKPHDKILTIHEKSKDASFSSHDISTHRRAGCVRAHSGWQKKAAGRAFRSLPRGESLVWPKDARVQLVSCVASNAHAKNLLPHISKV